MAKKQMQIRLTLRDEAMKKLHVFRRNMDKFASGMKNVFLPLVATTTVLTAGLGAVIKKSIDYGVQLDEISKQAQITTEQFSRLAYAAEQEHSSLQSLAKILPLLAKYMDYASYGQVTYTRQFEEMGIRITDVNGKLRSTYDVFLEMSDYYKHATDKTKALAVATTLLGRRGAELVPLLKLGSDGIEKLGDEAGRLGVVLDKKTAAQMKKFDDELVKIKTGFRGIGIAISKQLIPHLTLLAKSMGDANWQKFGADISNFINNLVVGGAGVLDIWNEVALKFVQIQIWMQETNASMKDTLADMFLGPAQDIFKRLGFVKEAKAQELSILQELYEQEKALQIKAAEDIGLGVAQKIMDMRESLNQDEQGSSLVSSESQGALDQNFQLFVANEQRKIESSREMWLAWNDEKSAMQMAQFQSETEFYSLALDTQKKAHQSFWPAIGKLRDSFSAGMSKMFVDMLKGTVDVKKAFQELGMKMVQILIDFGVQKAVNFALGKAMLAAEVATSSGAGATVASAWAPAASMVSLASFGSNAAPAAAAISGVSALTQSLAIPKLAEGGEITSPGNVLVGERGPEILSLPQGASVIPLHKNTGKTIHISTQIHVDAKIDHETDIQQLAEDIGFHINETLRGNV